MINRSFLRLTETYIRNPLTITTTTPTPTEKATRARTKTKLTPVALKPLTRRASSIIHRPSYIEGKFADFIISLACVVHIEKILDLVNTRAQHRSHSTLYFKAEIKMNLFVKNPNSRSSRYVSKDSCRWECQELNSIYEIKEKMGEGSFGKVHKVRSRIRNRSRRGLFDFKQQSSTYACKTVPISKVEDIVLLREECANLEAVQGHPHLLDFEQTFEDIDEVHIITELLEGGELYELILAMKKQRTYFRDDDSAWMIRNILDGLSYCHDVTKIVHRDMKASNFMFKRKIDVTGKGKANRTRTSQNLRDIKIIDFGLSTKINPKTGKVKGCLGTPYYVAPEVLTEEFYDSKCDVWSAGVIAYLVLSFQLPFMGKDEESTVQILMDAESHLPKYDSKRWKSLDPLAIDFCKSLLQVDPSKRPTARQAMSHPWIIKHCGHPPPQMTRIHLGESIIMVPMVEDDEVDPPLLASSTIASEEFDSWRTAEIASMDPIPEKPQRTGLLKRWFSSPDSDHRHKTKTMDLTQNETKPRRTRQKTQTTMIMEE